jgi:outer membrane cobalamin receptor
MKYFLFYIMTGLTLFPAAMHAQHNLEKDTFKLQEIELVGIRNKEKDLMKSIKLDSSFIADHQSGTLTDLLSQSTVFVKDYGSSMLATPAFRGTAGDHTKLSWNSIPLNSSMNGLQDLNLIPAFILDGVDINYSGASLVNGSGGFGGSIDLTSNAIIPKNNIQLGSTIGSFGEYKEYLGAGYRTGTLWGSTKAYYSTALNNFPYINTYSGNNQVETEKDASMYQYGILQSLGWALSEKDIIKANVWYQNTIRNLPQTMISNTNHEDEKDESLRSNINYRHFDNKYTVAIDGSYVKEYLLYQNVLSDINEGSANNRYELKTSIIPKFNIPLTLKVGIEDMEETALTKEYYGLKSRNRGGIWADASYDVSKKWQTGLVVRTESMDFKTPRVAFTGSVAFKAFNDERLVFHANGGHNFNFPNLNDLYWVPGGNPALKPENTWFGEAGISSVLKINSRNELKSVVTVFSNWISDYIQWAPTGSSYWQAQNLAKVWARGIESSSELKHGIKKGAVSLKIAYQFTPSTSKGTQLIYMPLHTAQANLRIDIKKYEFQVEYALTGSRNTSDVQLPAYNLVNVFAGRNFTFKKLHGNILLKCNNVFNESYQAIIWRPMPGRWFEVSLKVGV